MTAFSIPILVIYINAIFAFLLVEILHFIKAKKSQLRCEFFIKHAVFRPWNCIITCLAILWKKIRLYAPCTPICGDDALYAQG